MVNKCSVTGCLTGYATGERKSCFSFPENKELRRKWIYFVNRQSWEPTKNSVICINHFEEKFVKFGKRCTLKWELKPVPTIHPIVEGKVSNIRVPTLPRRSPRKRNIQEDEMVVFESSDKVKNFDDFDITQAPDGFKFQRCQNSVQFFNIVFDENTGIPQIHECIVLTRSCMSSYHIKVIMFHYRNGFVQTKTVK